MTMKKNLLAILPLLLFSLTGFAQLEKGNILLGGGLGFSSSTSTLEDTYLRSEVDNSSFSFGPNAGYFFKDTWVVGLSLPFLWQSTTRYESHTFTGAVNATQTENKTYAYGITPFVRKYFPFGEKMAFYGQVSTGYIHQSSENSAEGNNNYQNTVESNTLSVITTMGLSYFPKKWLGINLSVSPLSYSFSSSKDERQESDYESKSNGLDFGFDTAAIQLGFNFFLSKK